MSGIQDIINHFSVLSVALLQCGSAFFTLLGSLMVILGVFLQANSKTQGPAILAVVGAPLAFASGLVLLLVSTTLAKDVLVLPAKEMVQLGGHAAALGLVLIASGVGLVQALARAYSKNESVVFFPVAAFLSGGLMLLSGLSSTALALLS